MPNKSSNPPLNHPYISPARGLIGCVLALAAFGLIMLLSTSYFWAARRQGLTNPLLMIQNQTMYLLSSFVLLILVSQVPVRWIKKTTWLAYAAGIVLLTLVFVPGIGVDYHGSHRWIQLAGFTFQPSEFAKLSITLAVSWYAATYTERIGNFTDGFLMICAIVALPSALVLIEPDLGTGMFLVGLGFMVALAGGLRLMHLVPTIVAFIPPLMGLFWYRFDHFRERISVFLNPGSDPLGTGHQIRQSLIAIGSGGQYGAGLGLSRQKLFYLPQPNSDFIFSIIAEETGFAGCLLIILLYMGIVWFGFQIARRARDRFGSFVATGITLCITIQALLNIAVATAVFPTKGLPLPLVSKGGSSLVVTVIMVGVLLAIHNSGTDEISKTSERHGQPQPDV
jgi:cell division protein FtsW